MERERFDGADVTHLLRARGHVIDWPRLIARYGDYRLVLAAHLLLFRFAYSDARSADPGLGVRRGARRLHATCGGPGPPMCFGRCCRASNILRMSLSLAMETPGSRAGT